MKNGRIASSSTAVEWSEERGSLFGSELCLTWCYFLLCSWRVWAPSLLLCGPLKLSDTFLTADLLSTNFFGEIGLKAWGKAAGVVTPGLCSGGRAFHPGTTLLAVCIFFFLTGVLSPNHLFSSLRSASVLIFPPFLSVVHLRNIFIMKVNLFTAVAGKLFWCSRWCTLGKDRGQNCLFQHLASNWAWLEYYPPIINELFHPFCCATKILCYSWITMNIINDVVLSMGRRFAFRRLTLWHGLVVRFHEKSEEVFTLSDPLQSKRVSKITCWKKAIAAPEPSTVNCFTDILSTRLRRNFHPAITFWGKWATCAKCQQFHLSAGPILENISNGLQTPYWSNSAVPCRMESAIKKTPRRIIVVEKGSSGPQDGDILPYIIEVSESCGAFCLAVTCWNQRWQIALITPGTALHI